MERVPVADVLGVLREVDPLVVEVRVLERLVAVDRLQREAGGLPPVGVDVHARDVGVGVAEERRHVLGVLGRRRRRGGRGEEAAAVVLGGVRVVVLRLRVRAAEGHRGVVGPLDVVDVDGHRPGVGHPAEAPRDVLVGRAGEIDAVLGRRGGQRDLGGRRLKAVPGEPRDEPNDLAAARAPGPEGHLRRALLDREARQVAPVAVRELPPDAREALRPRRGPGEAVALAHLVASARRALDLAVDAVRLPFREVPARPIPVVQRERQRHLIEGAAPVVGRRVRVVVRRPVVRAAQHLAARVVGPLDVIDVEGHPAVRRHPAEPARDVGVGRADQVDAVLGRGRRQRHLDAALKRIAGVAHQELHDLAAAGAPGPEGDRRRALLDRQPRVIAPVAVRELPPDAREVLVAARGPGEAVAQPRLVPSARRALDLTVDVVRLPFREVPARPVVIVQRERQLRAVVLAAPVIDPGVLVVVGGVRIGAALALGDVRHLDVVDVEGHRVVARRRRHPAKAARDRRVVRLGQQEGVLGRGRRQRQLRGAGLIPVARVARQEPDDLAAAGAPGPEGDRRRPIGDVQPRVVAPVAVRVLPPDARKLLVAARGPGEAVAQPHLVPSALGTIDLAVDVARLPFREVPARAIVIIHRERQRDLLTAGGPARGPAGRAAGGPTCGAPGRAARGPAGRPTRGPAGASCRAARGSTIRHTAATRQDRALGAGRAPAVVAVVASTARCPCQ